MPSVAKSGGGVVALPQSRQAAQAAPDHDDIVRLVQLYVDSQNEPSEEKLRRFSTRTLVSPAPVLTATCLEEHEQDCDPRQPSGRCGR